MTWNVQMQLITIGSVRTPAPCHDGAAQEALAGVIASIGDAAFGSGALAQLNRWMPLGWWSIYRLLDDSPPTLHAAGSFGVPDGTQAAWRAYRSSLYRRDETFAAARPPIARGETVLTHWHAREIPAPQRERIYSRHGLRERLSIVSGDDEHGLLAINFYRHDSQPSFSDDAIDAVGRLARPLLACVKRHLSLPRTPAALDLPLGLLTSRQRDVCERMLKGWTHEGIAADLRLSAATVKTYRNRAFERLGIHHRNELFALIAGYATCKAPSAPASASIGSA